jgi:membrane fusion protein (multidrug efflux system)
MQVGVISVTARSVTLTQDLPGRVSAFFNAAVDARVSGIVTKRYFREGADVKAGDLLYQIDPLPYEASLKVAQGNLASAAANVVSTRAESERYGRLVGAGAVDRQDYDNALASFHSYEGNVVTDEGNVQTAKINLGYTRVVSPISGKIGIAQVTVGAYVQDGTATLLATVQQIDKVYVDVVQTTGQLIGLKRDLASGKLQSDGQGHIRVRLLQEDGSLYPQEGRLELSDVTVSTSTSTVTVRCIFPNPKEDLLPGMFVRAQLDQGSTPHALLIPQLAAAHNSKGEFTVLIAPPDGKVEVRVVQVSRAVGNQWLIESGLAAGEQIIVDNLQKLHPGTVIKAVPAHLPPGYLPAPEAPK